MTYCTLEEAWGSDFGKKKKKRTYDRLEEHSGVETRLPHNQKYIEPEESESIKTDNTSYQKLLEENTNLKKMLQSIQSSNNLNNNIDTELYDLFLFLAGGVLIISLLEILVKIK